MKFVMTFDVPLEDRVLARKVQRDLNKVGARMLLQLVWKSDRSSELIDIAKLVKRSDVDAKILEERFVF